MEYLEAILLLLGGIGALLLSFKILSDNIEKLANTGLKQLFNNTSDNPLIGIGIGALVTAIIQSSSASTVMVVGFVNAGIMSLFQATAIIMGANVGTTITGQIVQFGLLGSGDTIGFSTIVSVLAFIGVLGSMIFNDEKVKAVLMSLAGLGMVFISLDIMSSAMEVFRGLPEFVALLQNTTNPFLLMLIGAVLTALMQSSSAMTSIVIAMVAAGLAIGNGGNDVLFVILGTNIGTCVTALLSSIGANTNARRASIIHLLFNLIGSIVWFVFLLLYPGFMNDTLEQWFPGVPGTQIAMFHTIFNVACTLIFAPFISIFVKLATFIVPEEKEVVKTNYLDERLLKNNSIALDLATKETLYLGELSLNSLNRSIDAFLNKSLEGENEIREEINNIESINHAILDYLIKISSNDITREHEVIISSLHKILIDFGREVEIADNMLKYASSRINDDLVFTEHVDNGVVLLKEKLNNQFEIVKELFTKKTKKLLKSSDSIEDEIDGIRNDLIDGHIKRLEDGECSPRSNTVFISLVSNLERAGDHLSYIAHSLMEDGKRIVTLPTLSQVEEAK